MTTASILVESMFGNTLLFGLFALLLVIGILMLIRTPKEVIVIISGLAILGFISSSIFPKWIFTIIIIFLGLFIGILLLRFFFRQY